MRLSKEEQDLVEKIYSGEISSPKEFINKRMSLARVQNNTSNFMRSGARTISTGETVLVTENSMRDRSQLNGFIAFCRRLEKAGLIQLVEDPHSPGGDITIFSVKKGQEPPERNLQVDEATTSIYRQACKFSIVPFEELSVFSRRGFLTEDEYALNEERDARKRAERITLFIAIFSVAASVVTSIGIAWFNYMTYSKERVVTISNASEFSGPKEVRVIEMPASPIQVALPAASNNSLQGRRP